MQQVELTKGHFLVLAERLASEALRTKSSKVELSAFEHSLSLVDYDLGIEYYYSGEKSELWDCALEVLALSDYIVMR